MLLECDRQGQVIWLNSQARSVLRVQDNLVQLLEYGSPEPGFRFCLFRILKMPESLLLGAELQDWEPAGERPDAAGLRRLELQFLSHYFRLQTLEHGLSARAARRKHGGGRAAMRQLELERQRVGRDLHTGVGQMLAAIRLHLEIVSGQLNEAPAQVRQAIENLAVLASGAFDQVRSLSRRLHPPEWQRLTIEAALQQLWQLSGIPLRFEASLRLQTPDHEPEPEVKALLYRTAQEALSNIIEHSQASNVTLSLTQSGDLLILVLEDDGIGFDSASLATAPVNLAGGLGLRAITAQANALGAKLHVASGPNGTKLILSTHFSAEP
jgi:signal transduction histidine kinase